MQADVSVPKPVAPAGTDERLAVIDALRGFALLGILMVNIEGFGLVEAAMFDPTIDGGFSGATRATWAVNHIFFEEKMMTIFSLLLERGLSCLPTEPRHAAAARLDCTIGGWRGCW